jgi:nitroreductase
MLRELMIKSRSYRRFRQETAVEKHVLRELVDLARLCPSAGNLQPLKFVLSCDDQTNRKIFPHLRWAAYLKEWTGPAEGERPAAYVVILGDSYISPTIGPDHGIVAQSMMLGAVERGLGGCIIASINREGLKKDLGIPWGLEILIVLALGVPGEEVHLEDVGPGGDIRYWRDEAGIHHVPKRPLSDLILE